jgi:iron complex transport system ATP-binding protein
MVNDSWWILARALAQQANVLLFDEPTANLDLHHQVAMLELVRGLSRERGLAVLTALAPNGNARRLAPAE